MSSDTSQSIPDEIELKFYPVDIEEMREKLRRSKATCTQPMRLMRRATFARSNNPHLNFAYIRVRDEGHQITLSLKDYPDDTKGHTYQRELQVVVDDFAGTRRILQATGLKESAYQETMREQWELQGSEISIDIWPGLKPYIEIESPSAEELTRVASQLDMERVETERGGALRLYMREYGWTFDESEDLFHGGLYAELTFTRFPQGTRLTAK